MSVHPIALTPGLRVTHKFGWRGTVNSGRVRARDGRVYCAVDGGEPLWVDPEFLQPLEESRTRALLREHQQATDCTDAQMLDIVVAWFDFTVGRCRNQLMDFVVERLERLPGDVT